MKKYMVFFACCLAMFMSAGSVFAQAGQQITPPGQQIAPGHRIIPPGQQHIPGQRITPPGQQITPGQFGGYGLQVVSVVQAWAYGHKMPIALQGNIVQFYGGRDLYIFRDSSGDILVKIGPKEWQNIWYQGISIAETDNVEIYGEVHWPRHNWGTPEVHVRFLKKL
ncbi:MAG: NirD/YgiW/YdeI family stress tolerance protein [Treponema sp.]|nr:NirD/YgiW/YdeI family stress tolerance protein [Treponema sp.]